MAGAAFGRWDQALETLRSLDAGWLDLRSVDAATYGDIVHVQAARAECVAGLRSQLAAEANAGGHGEAWIDQQLARLVNGT